MDMDNQNMQDMDNTIGKSFTILDCAFNALIITPRLIRESMRSMEVLWPSGKRLHSELEKHHSEWEDSLFLWAMFNSYVSHYQRVYVFVNGFWLFKFPYEDCHIPNRHRVLNGLTPGSLELLLESSPWNLRLGTPVMGKWWMSIATSLWSAETHRWWWMDSGNHPRIYGRTIQVSEIL